MVGFSGVLRLAQYQFSLDWYHLRLRGRCHIFRWNVFNRKISMKKDWLEEIGDCISTANPENFTRVREYITTTRRDAIAECLEVVRDYQIANEEDPFKTREEIKIVDRDLERICTTLEKLNQKDSL